MVNDVPPYNYNSQPETNGGASQLAAGKQTKVWARPFYCQKRPFTKKECPFNQQITLATNFNKVNLASKS